MDTACQADAQACNPGLVCLYGFCKRSCEINGTCCPNDADTCDVTPPPCGHSGEPCCENNGCGASLLCENNVCRACGGYRQFCCPDSAAGCQAPYECDTDSGDPGICVCPNDAAICQ